MLTTVLLLGSLSSASAQWSPYGQFGGMGGGQMMGGGMGPRPIMPQFGGFGGGGQFGGMPFHQGGSSIRFAPQSFGGQGFPGSGQGFPGSGQGFPGSGAGGGFGGQFGGSSPFGGSGSQFGGLSGQGMGMGGRMGGSSFPPYGQQQGSQLVLPPGALSGPGFGGGAGMGMGSPFASSIDNSITSMNSLNNVPQFGGAGQQGLLGSGSGLAGSGSDSGVRRVIPPFLQGADKATEDRFYAIVQNPTWSAAEKEQRVQEFIATLDSNRQNTYEQFRREAASTQKTKRDKVHGLVEQMTPEAQQQFQKVSALMTNPGISDQERLKQISELYNKLSPQVRAEFDSKFTGI